MRLKVVVADAPILDLAVRRQSRLAVALDDVAALGEVALLEAPGLSVPMHAGAAHPIAGKEAAPAPDRQRRLIRPVAHRQRFLRRLQEEFLTHAVAQFVGCRTDVEIGCRIPPRSALERHDVEPRPREFEREDRAGPAEPDDDHVLAGKTRAHLETSQAGRPASETGGCV